MKIFFAPETKLHDPAFELHNGEMVPHAENQGRMVSMEAAVGPAEPVIDHGIEPILAVHDAGYIAFLQRAYQDWKDAGRAGNAIPYVFPVKGRRPLPLKRIDAELGQYSFDCGTPIAKHTWQAVYSGAQSALTALDYAMDNKAAAFTLSRPPGHHCGRDYFGGYCYLNYAAIAAAAALAKGASRAAVLDVDYHHGNGTQDIFYERGDVLTVSLHADPAMDYPFYWGHADETGSGKGAGTNLNLPMPRGTDWQNYQPVLARAVEAVHAFKPDILIVPFGADTYSQDPISHFKIETPHFAEMGAAISNAFDLPTLITMEGGYAVEALGQNVKSFLSGFSV